MAPARRAPTPRERAGSDGRLVFACIAPHGDLAIPEACPPSSAGLAIATQQAMGDLGRRLAAARPDVVVVLTPHGIHVERHLAVVVAGRVAGSLAEAPAISLDMPVDRELALATLEELSGAGLAAVGVSYGGNDPNEAVMPLDWGSLIPLWYLGGRLLPPLPVVIVAPARDLSPADHVTAGAAIARAAARSGRRVALVASADQSHAHLASGPYGFDPAARELDDLVVSMVRDGRLRDLAALDPALIEAGKPDSWWQMLMLLGATDGTWRSELLAYEVPTYFGMLTAVLEPAR